MLLPASPMLMAATGDRLAYVAYSSGNAGSGSSVSATLPGTARTGDLVVAFVMAGGLSASGLTISVPGGWTDYQSATATSNLTSRILTRRIAAGDSVFSFSLSSGTATGFLVILAVFRGANTEDAGHGQIVGAGGNGAIVLPALDSAKGGILLCSVFTERNTATHTTPSGMTSIASVQGSSRSCISVFMQVVGVGSTGTRSSTVSGATTGTSTGIPALLAQR